MSYNSIIKRYLSYLQQEYNSAIMGGQHTAELSYRPVLNEFFRDLAGELNNSGSIDIILEPRNQSRVGRPDWRIHDKNTLGIYGYIEAKGFSKEHFDILPYKEQIERYLTLRHKLIITDGIDFVFCMDESSSAKVVSLVEKNKLSQKDWSKLDLNPQFELYMRRFYADPAPQYCDEGTLVELVAMRTKLLANDVLRYASIPIDEAFEEEREVINLLGNLRELVYNHNDVSLRTDKVFADFSAQVIMFSLLYAHRVICLTDDSPLQKENKIKKYVTDEISEEKTLKPFKDLMLYIKDYATEDCFINQWVDECIKFLSFVKMTEQQLLNPDYHILFELFLSKFDAQSRFDYGAYYTPKVLADFVVRLTEEIVKENFNNRSLFEDENTIIDPCCGTGSFLEQIILQDKEEGTYNLCGFEIMPAPYMLANYRMAVLKKKYVNRKHITNILLANTLSNCVFGEPVDANTIEGRELARVNELSSLPIKLIIGNPPSSDSMRNNTGEDFSIITKMMDDFRPPQEGRRARQNIQKQICNPHQQFIRWACDKLLESHNHSVLSFVVPLSFLEAESYKYTRKYLSENFSNAWIIAVDADARTGVRSNSLFHTLQGRAIIILTRKYNSTNILSSYNFLSLTEHEMAEKIQWLEKPANMLLPLFTQNQISFDHYAFHPSKPFDEKLYDSFWPVSGEANQVAIFKNHCSGIKLAPTALFTHIKSPFLKRRSKDIARNGQAAAEEWMGRQDKPPQSEKVVAFQNALNNCGSQEKMDNMISENIKKYSFRPFLTSNVLLWKDVLKHYSKIGGGGTRLRPELIKAYSNEDVIGFAMAHAPKDLNPTLSQFVSFCWYHPDNDMCTRGNSHIYLNKYSTKDGMIGNIDFSLRDRVAEMLGISKIEADTEVVFYTYAILCSQVYLDNFEGALFTVNRSDKRARVPIVADAEQFRVISAFGRKIAELEKQDFIPDNVLNFDYDFICDKLKSGFKLEYSAHPFDEELEILLLKSGQDVLKIPCPINLQRLNISGYNIIKSVWLKFNSYNFTHCEFVKTDLIGLLNLLNKLTLHMNLVSMLDIEVHKIITGINNLILPVFENER